MMWKPQREYLQKEAQSSTDGNFCWPKHYGSLIGNLESAGDVPNCDTASDTQDCDESMDEYDEDDIDDLDVDFGDCDPAITFIPEARMDMEYEKEDWDKELTVDDPYGNMKGRAGTQKFSSSLSRSAAAAACQPGCTTGYLSLQSSGGFQRRIYAGPPGNKQTLKILTLIFSQKIWWQPA
uniref:Coordinator of PRMT5 and differentiation stimulator isoform X2 n=1 Tax=Geotrypetes seraphini TaxID=260995 RepID=A0A6P8SMN3_GEOSA|nr:coordinator of PRMT5 and differentiation stimulator isoform X2 [Geotrypetes seraphini]